MPPTTEIEMPTETVWNLPTEKYMLGHGDVGNIWQSKIEQRLDDIDAKLKEILRQLPGTDNGD